jgi:hypothetical protein
MRKKLIRVLRKVVSRTDAVHDLISTLYFLLGSKAYLADIEKALENSELDNPEYQSAVRMLAADLKSKR